LRTECVSKAFAAVPVGSAKLTMSQMTQRFALMRLMNR